MKNFFKWILGLMLVYGVADIGKKILRPGKAEFQAEMAQAANQMNKDLPISINGLMNVTKIEYLKEQNTIVHHIDLADGVYFRGFDSGGGLEGKMRDGFCRQKGLLDAAKKNGLSVRYLVKGAQEAGSPLNFVMPITFTKADC